MKNIIQILNEIKDAKKSGDKCITIDAGLSEESSNWFKAHGFIVDKFIRYDLISWPLDFSDYFKNSYDYATDQIVDGPCMLEDNTEYNYISGFFLNGLINYIKPVKVYVIDRYFYDEEKFQGQSDPYHKAKLNLRLPGDYWTEYEFDSKQAAIDFLHSNDYEMYHTNLRCFDDDVLFLGKTEKYYWYFWFDCDSSDCSIGRFITNDSEEEEVIKRFTKHAKEISETGKIYEFEKEWIKGWIQW